jgi:hypothetical protein
MRHPDYPDRISDIQECDFWSGLKAGSGLNTSLVLREAIRLGLKGARHSAYLKLAEYHQQSLVREWDFLRHNGPPAAIHAPRQTADEVVKHRLFFTRSACRSFGRAIDWDSPKTGSIMDSFYWYIPLVRAYLARPCEKYRFALCDIINQYYAARHRRRFPSPHYHPVYTALSGSIKLRHILPAYVALAVQGGLDPQTTESFLKLSLGIARALYRRETDFTLSNQTITNAESFGLFASLFPEFGESPDLRSRAIDRILRNVEEGFLTDGGYYERSLDYTGVSINDSSRAVLMFERHAPLDPATRRRFEKVFRRAGCFMARVLGPDNYCPPYADGCIGKGTHSLECLLPFFPKGTPAGCGEDRSKSYRFKETGFAVMRNGGAREDAYAFFSFAPCHLWHSHQDCLTLDFWKYGQPLLLEAGRFDTYDHPQSRLFRMPEMHNVPTVEGQTWDERHPEFWRGEDVKWISSPEFDYIAASHRAYQGQMPVLPQAQSYRVRRAVVFVKKAGYILIHDSVDNRTTTPVGVIAQHWHSPQPFEILGPGYGRTLGRIGVVVRTVATETLRRTETSDDYLPAEVKVDNDFPERHRLSFRRWADSTTGGPQGFVTVLYPFKGRAPKIEITVSRLKGGVPWQAECVTVVSPSGKDTFILNPDHRVIQGKSSSPCVVRFGS